MKTLLFTIVLVAAALAGADNSPWIPTRIPALRYPALGLQARIEGIVGLRVSVDASGTVARVRVMSGPPVLAKAAQENIKLWRFAPLRGDSQPTGGEIDFIYVFKLKGEALDAPVSDFVYEYPGKVTVTSHPQHWMP